VATLPSPVGLRGPNGPAQPGSHSAEPDNFDSLPAGNDPADGSDSDLSDWQAGPSSDLGDWAGDSLPAPQDATLQHRPTLSQVGRYALKEPLGIGGLGQVHEAWDPLLSRSVAVKTLQLHADASTQAALDAMFLNEARAAASLSHPHIVTVFDAGLAPQGAYIAMEKLKGRDLRQALADGWAPTPWQAAQLARRLADALAYAHAKGVVHCDVKPANIYLDRRDRPKLLDFGIARILHRKNLPGHAQLQGLVMGSPHYLAPEQLQSGEADARTDIYALGVVLYELLTRRKAFGGSSLAQITQAVLHSHPAAAHEVAGGTPRTLSRVAARAMARDPAQRFKSASEMAGALRRWSDQHSSTGVQPLSEDTFSSAAMQAPLDAAADVKLPQPAPSRVEQTARTTDLPTKRTADGPADASARQGPWPKALAAALVLAALGAALIWWATTHPSSPLRI